MNILDKFNSAYVEHPVKIVQFGEGNFLRAFVENMVDIANEKGIFNGDVVIVKPRPHGTLENYRRQHCGYTVSLRGLVDGEAKVINRSISCVRDIVHAYDEYDRWMKLAEAESLRFAVSNTTEAGIVFEANDPFQADSPVQTFPGKLTQFLYHRYRYFHGAKDKGLILLPVELIDDNGAKLKECVLKYVQSWNLETSFKEWIESACIFASTLVDRIVTGYPRSSEEEEWQKLGYEDHLMVVGEPFALWVIESERDIEKEFPLDRAGLPVLFTNNHKPYKQRKVRILNGAHTSFVLASYLMGNDFVKQSMDDQDVCSFMMKTIEDEIIPTLALPEKELRTFAADVVQRFQNPFVRHALLSISLNSVSKWKVRCLPSLLDYREKFGKLPPHLVFSLAALIAFYNGTEIRDNTLIGHRDGVEYPIRDDPAVLEFFRCSSRLPAADLVRALFEREDFFGCRLMEVEGLSEMVASQLEDIRKNGMRAALCRIS